MNNLIPHFIADKYLQEKFSGKFHSFIMTVDLSGFTSMTEALMNNGKEGAEILCKIINIIFTPSIEFVYQNGGFVSNFAGDAFTAIFDIENPEKVLNASFEINRLFKTDGLIKTRFGQFQLNSKIGLASGNIEYGIINSDFNWTYFFRGDGIDNCAKAEIMAGKDQIIADNIFIKSLSSDIKIREIQKDYFIIEPGNQNTHIDKIQYSENIDNEIIKQFIPNEVLEQKSKGEFREIVSCFIGFKNIDDYKRSIKIIIRNCNLYGGYISHIDFGDKGGILLVLFGAPKAREKLFDRSARFALSLFEIQNFTFRAGLSTGTAFAGFLGSEIRKDYTAMGSVVNLSSRLVMKAEWMQILVDERIADILHEKYSLDEYGSFQFKGFDKKSRVYSLNSQLIKEYKRTFTHSFIGRRLETELLKDLCIPIFRNNFGGIVYIDGPPGIGKSRFISNFSNIIDNCYFFYIPCDDILMKSFNPFVNFFKRYFKQTESDSYLKNLEKFQDKYHKLIKKTKVLNIKKELIRTESIIASFIGLERKNSLYDILDAKGRYENTLSSIKNFFIAESLQKPVLLILEDAHWIDPDSIALISNLLTNIDNYPLIIIALVRPSDDGTTFRFFNNINTTVNEIQLKPFNRKMMEEYLLDMLKAEKLPENTSNFFWNKSNGNPFFIEQIYLYLKENSQFDEHFNIIEEAEGLPVGIGQIIIARIDRLSQKLRETLKTASVLGKEFALRTLKELLLVENIILKNNDFTKQLQKGRIEQIWEEVSALRYTFKHALIRDAVYEMQLRSRLRNLHNLAGDTIEKLYKDNLKEHYEELAGHYEKAENLKKTVLYLEKSAEHAKEKYQNQKSIAYYKRLMNNLNSKDKKFINALIQSGDILKLTGKWKESIRLYEEALKFSELLNINEFTIECLNNTGYLFSLMGRPDKAKDLLTRSLLLAKKHGILHGLCKAINNLGLVHKEQGSYAEALEHFSHQLAISEKLGDKKLIIKAKGNIGIIYHLRGELSKALEYLDEVLILCEELGDKIGIGVTFGSIGQIYRNQGKYKDAMKAYEKQIAICIELGNKRGISQAMGNMGIVYQNQGEHYKAMECYRKVLDIFRELGDKGGISKALGHMAMIFHIQGNYDRSMELFNEQHKICEDIQDKVGLRAAVCNMGIVYLDMGEHNKAMECNQKLLKICKEIGDNTGIGIAYGNIGNVLNEERKIDIAIKYYDKAIDILENLHNKYYLCNYKFKKAELLFLQERKNEAEYLNHEAFQIAKQIKKQDTIFDTSVLSHKILNNSNALLKMLSIKDYNEEQIANINYELWKMTGNELYRKNAENIFLIILERKPKYIYKKRLDHLSI